MTRQECAVWFIHHLLDGAAKRAEAAFDRDALL